MSDMTYQILLCSYLQGSGYCLSPLSPTPTYSQPLFPTPLARTSSFCGLPGVVTRVLISEVSRTPIIIHFALCCYIHQFSVTTDHGGKKKKESISVDNDSKHIPPCLHYAAKALSCPECQG